jgi:pyruvate formate lyase activating enzyme
MILSEDIMQFLKKRKGKLDAVVITGGEPTLQKNLFGFISKVKELDFLVKLDTNGTNPLILENLLSKNLLDYVAMDIKAPLDKYKTITNFDVDSNLVQKSIDIIKTSKIAHEFRTTVVKEQLSVDDIVKIANLTKGSKHYFQKFVFSKHVDEAFKEKSTYCNKEFEQIAYNLEQAGFDCSIR